MLDKNRSITFAGVTVYYRFRKCNAFRQGQATALSIFGDHPTSIPTSFDEYVKFIYIGRAVCESTPVIQLFSYALAKNRSSTFAGTFVYFLSHKRNQYYICGKYYICGCYTVYRAFSSNFGKRPLAEIGKK